MVPSPTPAPPPVLPDAHEHLSEHPQLGQAWEAEVRARRAEAEKIQHLLDYRDHRLAVQSQALPHTFTRKAAVKAVHHEAAVVLGVTDAEVRRMFSVADTAGKWLPQAWEAYQEGRIDFTRLQRLVSGAGDLIETNSGNPEAQHQLSASLDKHFASVAPRENKNVLDQQVRDFVAEADPAGHQRRYERARSQRYVQVTHHHNGMSTLRALLPTLTLARLEENLHTAARTMQRTLKSHAQKSTDPMNPGPVNHGEAESLPSAGGGATEEATLSNRMADILCSWLQAGSASEDPTRPAPASETRSSITRPVRTGATINITVPLQTLVGETEAPALSSDGRFVLPAAEARRIANDTTAANTYYLTGTTIGADGAPKVERVVKLGRKNPLEGLVEGPGSGDLARQALVQQIHSRPNLLAASSTARFVTGNLRAGIQLRDRQCQAHGCTEPATLSEVDHKTSHESGGATDGSNSWVLCHTHHEIKSHGLLPGVDTDSDPPARASPDPPLTGFTTGESPPAWATGSAA